MYLNFAIGNTHWGGGDGEEFPFINLIMSTCPVRLVDVSKWDVC